MGDKFAVVEKMIQGIFLPRLLFGKSKNIPPIVGTLSTMPVKKYVMGLLSSVMSSNKRYISLKCSSTELIRSMVGRGAFSNADHLLDLREERRDGKKNQDDVNVTKL